MKDTNDIIARVLELDKKATPGKWEAIHDERVGDFVQTVERICKNDPGNYPPDFPQQILADGDYNDKAWDCDLIAEYRTLCPLLATRLSRYAEVVEAGKMLSEACDDLSVFLLTEKNVLVTERFAEVIAEFNAALASLTSGEGS